MIDKPPILEPILYVYVAIAKKICLVTSTIRIRVDWEITIGELVDYVIPTFLI